MARRSSDDRIAIPFAGLQRHPEYLDSIQPCPRRVCQRGAPIFSQMDFYFQVVVDHFAAGTVEWQRLDEAYENSDLMCGGVC